MKLTYNEKRNIENDMVNVIIDAYNFSFIVRTLGYSVIA